MFYRFAFLLFSLLLIESCTRKPAPPGVAVVAVLPFENLSGDATLDWLTDGLPHVIVWQQTSAPDVFVVAARDLPAAVEQGAQRIVRGSIEREKGGRIRVDAWLEDRASRRQTWQQSYHLRPDNSLFGAATEISATAASVAPKPYATANIDALRAYLQARALAADPAAARERFGAALTADPAYSVAHLTLVTYEISQRDLAAAKQALTRFQQQVPRPTESEKSEVAQLQAALDNDYPALAQAVQAMAKARPANLALQLQAAEQASRLLPPQAAAEAWQRVLRVQPGNPLALRKLAQAKAALNDFAGAEALLAQAPQDAKTVDARAEVAYQAGRFSSAAQLWEQLAAAKLPDAESQGYALRAFTKAAYARLLAGDEKAAQALFEKGVAARQLDSVVASTVRASWLFQTGHRAEALALVTPAPDAAPPAKAVMASQRCVLHAAAGDWNLARADAQAANGHPASLLCSFVAQPAGTEAEWKQRAETRFPGPALASARQRVLAYALALRGHCPAAIASLRGTMADPNYPDNTEPRLLLGRCYLNLQQWGPMRDALQAPPAPPAEPTFSPLFFPSQLELRAKVEAHYERAVEAKRWLNLYQRLTGPAAAAGAN